MFKKNEAFLLLLSFLAFATGFEFHKLIKHAYPFSVFGELLGFLNVILISWGGWVFVVAGTIASLSRNLLLLTLYFFAVLFYSILRDSFVYGFEIARLNNAFEFYFMFYLMLLLFVVPILFAIKFCRWK